MSEDFGLRIGDLEIASKVMLAPMAGTTDYAYRELVWSFGCGLMFTEMISAKALVYGDKKTIKLLQISNAQRPIGVQIFGAEPEFMAKAAQRVVKEVAPDVIDINMGCPVPKIVNNGEGSALMKNPDLAASIVKAIVEAVDVPITVKMRAGFNKENINAPDVAQAVGEAGAAMITVHGRTREQYYAGNADWSIIAQVKEVVDKPVIGNGDVFAIEDAVRLIKQTNCDGIMIGRGAQGKPWLCYQIDNYLKSGELIDEPSVGEKFAIMKQHLDLAIANKGEYTGIREMRSHLAWYVKGLPHAAAFRQLLFTKSCYNDVCALLGEYRHQLGN